MGCRWNRYLGFHLSRDEALGNVTLWAPPHQHFTPFLVAGMVVLTVTALSLELVPLVRDSRSLLISDRPFTLRNLYWFSLQHCSKQLVVGMVVLVGFYSNSWYSFHLAIELTHLLPSAP